MNWKQYYDRLKAINLTDLTSQVIATNEEDVANEIVRLNQSQLDGGMKADGTFLPPYSFTTVQTKKQKGQEFGVMNLQDTNAFRSKMYVELTGATFTVNSTDSKTAELKARYGAILGLTSYNRKYIWNAFLRGAVVVKIKERLRG